MYYKYNINTSNGVNYKIYLNLFNYLGEFPVIYGINSEYKGNDLN